MPRKYCTSLPTRAKIQGIEIQYIQPGKPAQNAFIERFNRTYREAVLDRYLFRNIQEIQNITD
jgi:putative transposase